MAQADPAMHQQCKLLFFASLAIASVSGKCDIISIKNGQISCKNITAGEYVDILFASKATIINSLPVGSGSRTSIDIADSFLPVIDDWLFLPLDDNFSSVSSLKIVNCSVSSMAAKNLSKLSMVETLDLSWNNISDYRFLNKMKRLRYLYLGHSVLSADSYLFAYLQRSQTRLELIDLSYCNLKTFTITAPVAKYDLSFNPSLTSINFNFSSLYYSPPFLNLSGHNGNLIKLQHSRATFCLSLDVSNSNKSLDDLVLKNMFISQEILLSRNNIGSLDENNFKFLDVMSLKCSGRISINLSRANLSSISPNYFSLHILNVLDLSFNNLSALTGSVFTKADIFHLDLSRSFIVSIESGVFQYLVAGFLDLSQNSIASLSGVFDHVESVKHLDISSNPIETLSGKTFRNCADLETLKLENVFVKTMPENPFAGIASLRSLTLSLTESVSSELIHSMYTTELTIANTTLEKLSAGQFKGFYRLKKLTFSESTVSATIDNLALNGLFSLKKIINLKELGKYDINVFQSLYSLEYLDLSRHDLKRLNLELADLLSLKKLNLSLNAISSVDVNAFAAMKRLEVLSLAQNQLSTLHVGVFRHLAQLTHLYLNGNQLQQLPAGIFAGLDNLFLLDLSRNDLLRTKPHLVFGVSMPKLAFLHLQSNGIGNEYAQGDAILRRNELTIIANHNGLEYVDINDNGWRCPTLIDVLIMFRNKNISYHPDSPDYGSTNINGVSCV